MTCMTRITLLAIALIAASAGVARAQLGPFVMGENSRTSYIGFESGMAFFSNPEPFDDGFGAHFDLVADIRVANQFKIFGRFPLVFTSEPDTGFGIGNFTIGGRYIIPISRGRGTVMRFAPQGSVSIGTASDSDEGGIAASTVAYLWAPHDPGWYAPNVNTLCFGGDFSLDTQSFFFHAGLGLHYYMFDGDDETALRLGLAAGFKVSPLFAIVGELSYLSDFDANAADLGVRWRAGRIILGARVYIPFDDRRDNDVIGIGFDLHSQF